VSPQLQSEEQPILCIHRRPYDDCAECLADEHVDEPEAEREFINGGW
jgi:hypothetical protein